MGRFLRDKKRGDLGDTYLKDLGNTLVSGAAVHHWLPRARRRGPLWLASYMDRTSPVRG